MVRYRCARATQGARRSTMSAGRVARQRDDRLHRLEQGRVGPVNVVDHDQQRTLAREDLDQPAEGPRQLLLAVRPRRETHRARETVRDHRPRSSPGQQCLQPLDRGLARLVFPDACGLANDLRKSPVGHPLAVRETTSAQDPSVRRHDLCQLCDQPRLAHARFTDDRRRSTSSFAHGQRRTSPRADPARPGARPCARSDA